MPRFSPNINGNTHRLSVNSNRGFTLVELLIAITLIAILATMSVIIYTGVQKKARDAKRREDINAIYNALETNYSNLGAYNALTNNMFAKNIVPTDPLEGGFNCNGGFCGYCFNPTGAVCTSSDEVVGVGKPSVLSSWKICANLEDGTTTCLNSQR